MKETKRATKLGRRFGKLIAIEKLTLNNLSHYKCKCDCGRETIVDSRNLKTGKGAIRSCGCLKGLGHRSRKKKDLHLLLINKLTTVYKCNAKKRNYEFSLTADEFIQLVEGNCYYCGTPKSNLVKDSYGGRSMLFNGIDRVDSTKGYIYENCVPCCKQCNSAKSNLAFEEFRSWVIRTAKHLTKDFIGKKIVT